MTATDRPTRLHVVGEPLPDESAVLHVTGTATYADDAREPEGMAHGVLVLSPVASGRLDRIDSEAALRHPGVLAVVTAADIPGANSFEPDPQGNPLLADGEVSYVGQPVAVVVADTRRAAEQAAALVSVHVDPRPMTLDPLQSHAREEYVVPPLHLVEPTADAVDAAIAAASHRLRGSFASGGQEHLYIETQVSTAMRTDDGGCIVHASTQHPTELQQVVARALQLPENHVRVDCRRMGGAFGGRESSAQAFGALAALSATKVGRPVRVRLDRVADDHVTGKRHPFQSEWECGFDDDGVITGYRVRFVSNAGHSADLSAPVMARAICHVDSAYFLPAIAVDGYPARTNLQSHTAFRGFGGPQGALVTEVVVDTIARQLGRDPLDVRLANLYGSPTHESLGAAALRTPYGMTVDADMLPRLLAELIDSSDYRNRRRMVEEFNSSSPVLKKGLALTPVKFGIGFNLTHLNQAGALVHVYTDGSVLVNHAATEMGQGVNTKVAQVVAERLGVPLARVRSTATDTEKVANTSATAASTGSDLNAMAADLAASRIRERLLPIAARLLDAEEDGIWFANDEVGSADRSIPFADLVGEAYRQRVQLWSDGFYRTPGLSWDWTTLKGRPFLYFCYGASVSEVVIDTLTGEHRVLRADLLHDVGRSLNPRIDIGQVEGAFVQGMGWLTTEELRWDQGTGALQTLAPTTYKVPTAHDVPQDFRVALFDSVNPEPTIHRSKAVGEPPLLLAFSVFLAIRDAVAACGPPGSIPPLDAPATAEAILRSIHAVRGGSSDHGGG